ncbi:TIGR03085 family metal-binding protein [Motilibacter aurantiacus]|uniref:TIGR03085 family metal-binding protein n=1 Tax=Motilibacter aurantiacus TaxID=2714955 RepID=UPI00140A1D90|nr:TIGR03085 family metal-binding protein [Motilibacter aurantiacus]NHC45510.1 TIGR03085 family protein [Motilibacter aurantiacus]
MGQFAAAERAALCATLEAVGPDAPTLDEGWTARDLAAHLVLRERRLDAAPGILLKPLAGWTARVQRGIADRPWPGLVDAVRSGPPRWSPYALPGLDEQANLVELVVHHEDVRRARDGCEPRALPPGLEDALWARLARMGRLLYRSSRVPVLLRRDTGQEARAKGGTGSPVVVEGPAVELLMHAFGRGRAARVRLEGDADAVAQLSPGLPG